MSLAVPLPTGARPFSELATLTGLLRRLAEDSPAADR